MQTETTKRMAKRKTKTKSKPKAKAVKKISKAKIKKGLKLNIRQKKFGDLIATGLLPEAAAVKAGYSENYAKSSAHKLMGNVGITTYIKTITKVEADKHGITRDKLTTIILEAIESAKVASIITGQQDSKSQIAGAVALSKMYGLNAPEVKEEFKHTLLTIKFQ